MDLVKELLDLGGQLGVNYNDFTEAVDKVQHKRLVNKLYSYSISEEIIEIQFIPC
jgi:hypothetical protein